VLTFKERKLGNIRVGIFWKLKNGSMIVDSNYNVDKIMLKARVIHVCSTYSFAKFDIDYNLYDYLPIRICCYPS